LNKLTNINYTNIDDIMGWKSKKKKRNNQKKLQLYQIKNEISYLKYIQYLPEDIVREIKSFLKLDVLNIISPLKGLHNPDFLAYSRYWINYHLYFWISFNHIGEREKNEIKKYYQNIQNTNYIRGRKKIYDINDPKTAKIMEKYVKKEVAKFEYEGDQHKANIKERLAVLYSEGLIKKIIT
jgi:hypothetical protein